MMNTSALHWHTKGKRGWNHFANYLCSPHRFHPLLSETTIPEFCVHILPFHHNLFMNICIPKQYVGCFAYF